MKRDEANHATVAPDWRKAALSVASVVQIEDAVLHKLARSHADVLCGQIKAVILKVTGIDGDESVVINGGGAVRLS